LYTTVIEANLMSKCIGFAVAVSVGLLFIHFQLEAQTGQSPLFDGRTLSGWHIQGSAGWSVKDGSIVGSVGGDDTVGGWLVLDRPHEDFLLRFSFRCTDCETGVLFRRAKLGAGLGGTYVALSGTDAGSVYRATVDSQGRELERKLLGVPPGQDDQPLEIKPDVSGWNRVWIFVRGDALGGQFNSTRIREFHFGSSKSDESASYGQIAFRVSGRPGAEVWIRDISFEDLTETSSLPAVGTDGPFRERKLTDMFYSEGIAVGDLNRDGVQDVVAGPFYYLGPDYNLAREIYTPKTFNPNTPPYTDSFLNYVYDFNGDGWPDVLKINFEGAYLYLNPRGEARHWDVYRVVNGIAAETTQFVDIDGDGRPELVISQSRGTHTQTCQIGYAKPDWSDPTKPWTFYPVSEVGNWGHHGMGVGDINQDGRLDILQSKGWWEQPASGTGALWKFHAAPFGGGEWTEMAGAWAGGSDMFVYDVNGDGLPDVITSLAAHGWGLAWFEQSRDRRGEISWKRHMIMGNPAAPDRQEWEETDKSVAFSELHALALADIDGDGLKDIITGKRWWSHGDNHGTPDVRSAAVLYWFKLVRKSRSEIEWIPHRINNNSGVGTQIVAADLKGDGKVDILTSARKGAFVFLNDR
jgi:hypothetical protein